jgi:branched-chain amino acid transport system substrate-binding protein
MITLKRSILSLALIGAGLFSQHTFAADLVIKIGSAAPLTGPQALLGKDNDSGVRLAVEEINAAGLTIGGQKAVVEVVSEDDQADPRAATIVAQKFVDQKVNGVIGHLNSGATIPASKIYHDAGIVQISPSATAIAYTAQGYNTAFRVMANDSQQGLALANYAVKSLQAKTIAIIDDRTAYGQGLADEFEKDAKAAGASIVAREYTNDKAVDFTAIVTSIKGKKPDVVFFAGMAPQAGPMARQIVGLQLKARFLTADGAKSPEFIKLAGNAAEGTIASSPGVVLENTPSGKAFTEKFEKKFGKIQNYAPYAYDATLTLIDAMKAANSAEPAKYLPFLAKINRNGVIGTVAFDAKGDIKGGAVTLYQVQKGNWVAVPVK